MFWLSLLFFLGFVPEFNGFHAPTPRFITHHICMNNENYKYAKEYYEFYNTYKTPTKKNKFPFLRSPVVNYKSFARKHNETYSLFENSGFLRLYSKPGIIENRKRFSFVGFRQKESDFEFEVKMKFIPEDDEVEAGVIHYQMEYNYLANLVTKTKKKFFLEQRLREKEKKAVTLKKVLLKNYSGHIVFRLISKSDKHDFYYSLDNGLNFIVCICKFDILP